MGRADSDTQTVQPGMLAHDHAGGARVVEVDVREEQVPDVGELEAPLGEPRRRARERRGRAAVEEGGTVGRVDR